MGVVLNNENARIVVDCFEYPIIVGIDIDAYNIKITEFRFLDNIIDIVRIDEARFELQVFVVLESIL